MNERLLRIDSPIAVAGMVWRKGDDGKWSCKRKEDCAPILRKHFLGKDPAYVKQMLEYWSWDYAWIGGSDGQVGEADVRRWKSEDGQWRQGQPTKHEERHRHFREDGQSSAEG